MVFAFQALPLEDLRSACRARELPSDGPRAELVGRLAALLAPEPESQASQEAWTVHISRSRGIMKSQLIYN